VIQTPLKIDVVQQLWQLLKLPTLLELGPYTEVGVRLVTVEFLVTLRYFVFVLHAEIDS
jgi:hypothetical protein